MNTNQSKETEISTKELLLSFFSTLNLLTSTWKIWLSAMLIGTLLSLVKDLAVNKVTSYRSSIIFNLELGGSGGGSQLSGLASTFGIFSQNNVSGGELFTSQNFPTIMRSRSVIEKALMNEVIVKGDTLLLINYVADSSDIKTNEWGGGIFTPPFHGAIHYKFKKKSTDEFTELENEIINSIYQKLTDATEIEGIKPTNSILLLTTVLTNEKLAKVWVESVLNTTEEFYVEMKTKKTRELLSIQNKQLDKLAASLGMLDTRIARLTFENPNVVDPRGRLQETKANRQSSFITNQYLAQLNTVEGLKRMLLEQTPIFTVMDETRLPLEKEYTKSSLDLKLIAIAFLILSMIWIILNNSYKNIMEN
jgi:hypothetical protein